MDSVHKGSVLRMFNLTRFFLLTQQSCTKCSYFDFHNYFIYVCVSHCVKHLQLHNSLSMQQSETPT